MEENKPSSNTKGILISCIVLLVVVGLCLGVLFLAGVGVSIFSPFEIFPKSSPEPLPSPISGVPEPTSALPEPTSDLLEPTSEITKPDSKLPDQLAETIAEIESQVMQIRGLEKREPVVYTMISMEELEEIVVEDFFAEYSDKDAYQDVLVLSSLGLLPENFDLKDFYEALYSEQIAGFYDSETKEIYIVQGQEFGGSEKLTYAHEFTHVLQDQVYGLEEGLGINEEACEQDSERCAAVQALIEGDASQSEILWFQTNASREDFDDLMDMFDLLETPVLDSAPPYMAADLYFPYEKGFAFVQELYDEGGYEAVDAAFLDPPVSTEQILHPEKYPDDAPMQVTLPDLTETLGDPWTLFDQNIMGEWYTFLILNKGHDESIQLTESLAMDAAEGWGGDAYAIYLNENTDETIFIMDTRWDTVGDADEFVDAFYQYANGRWSSLSMTLSDARVWQGTNGFTAFWHDDDRTLWVMAPDQDMLSTIVSEFQ